VGYLALSKLVRKPKKVSSLYWGRGKHLSVSLGSNLEAKHKGGLACLNPLGSLVSFLTACNIRVGC
jgi:hypothetical protein